MSITDHLTHEERERYAAASGIMIDHFTKRGAMLTPEDLRGVDVPDLTVAAMAGGTLNIEAAAAQIERALPSISEQTRARALQVQNEQNRGAYTQAEFDRLPNVKKMELGRAMAKQDAAREKAQERTRAEGVDMGSKVALLASVKDPATRLSLARSWGVV